jgi:alpha-L-rhamnosidase
MGFSRESLQIWGEAFWIWPGYRLYDLHNTYAHFRKDFQLEAVPVKAVLHITADQSYRLWINGIYVTRGPARGYQSHWPYDEVDIASCLRVGQNFICVEAYNAGVSTFGYVSQNAAGFLCAADIGNQKLCSDDSWLTRYDPAHKKDTALYSYQLNFQEHVDARLDDRSWITSPEIPEGWSKPDMTPFGAMPWHSLEERGIPQLREIQRQPRKLVSSTEGKIAPEYREWRNIAKGLHHAFQGNAWKKEEMELKESSVGIAAAGEGKFRTVVLDMGETVVGPSILSVEGGNDGDILDIFYSEVLENDLSPTIPYSGGCEASMSNRLILAGEKTSYEFFQVLGFRYITLVVNESTADWKVTVTVSDTGYPYSMQGMFECSDSILNDIWKICRRTEQVCSLDAYVDTPWREQAQWWGDARIQFWNTMAMDGDTRLLKRGIRSIAGQKVPNGLTYGHAPTMAHTCVLTDFSLVWMVTIYDYYRQTGDLSVFAEQLPRIREVLSYFRKDAPRYKGLISYDKRYWLFLDWSDLERDGSPTLYNMWYLMALRSFAELLRLSGNTAEAEDVEKEGEALQAAIEELLFDKKEGLFYDRVDNNGISSQKHSVHSQTFAVMLGLKTEWQDHMFKLRILPFLRGEKMEVPVPSTYWTSYVFTAARENGYEKEVVDYIKRMWSPMIPYSTCWETFALDKGCGSSSHAWSAHPLFHFMNILGGIIQESVKWEAITFKPFFASDLEYAHTIMPSPYGLIKSRWKRSNDGIDVTLELPEGVTAKVAIPGFEGDVQGTFRCRI